ncbi:hypothetical protein [Nostoc sp. 'Peltigera membranacea cyanobiont' N6]|uniref:hypothetical protein n=1 Tax=Nostoc sp. 'Peltigera membranacea cyanobiont' N6 TaxID=1261031 RepID=UPI0015E3FC99|nr:hypothetical protein [Nostoc sp. 'Peltigera membranacea cyanobiont' N6]
MVSEFEDLLLEDNEYILNLPYHLTLAGMANDLREILTEFEFIKHKVRNVNAELLIEDYDLALQPHIKIDENKKESLRLIQGAIRLSTYALNEDKMQLAGQLWGRLLPFKLSSIQTLLNQTKQRKENPWLCPLIPNLISPGGSLLRTIFGHTHAVRAVAITADGKRAISGAQDNTLKLWDLATGTEIHTLGHTSWVTQVVLTPDGQWAISRCHDGSLRLWDLEKGQEKFILNTSTFSHILSGNPQKFWILSPNKQQLQLWNLIDGQKLYEISLNIGAVKASTGTPDGKWALFGLESGELKLWDLKINAEVYTLAGHKDTITSVAITPNKQWAISSSDDQTLKLWDLNIAKERITLKGHTKGISKVIITPCGQLALSISSDGLKLWDLKRGIEKQTLTQQFSTTVAITPDLTRAISGFGIGTLKIWDLKNSTEAHTSIAHSGSVNAIEVTPDGQLAVSGSSDNKLKVWNVKSGVEIISLTGHTEAIRSVAITTDGQRVVSSSNDGTIKIWDLETGKELYTLSGHTLGVGAVVITANGKQILAGLGDGNLKVWDLESRKELYTLSGHTEMITAIAATPNGRWALSGSTDCSLRLWDLESRKQLNTLAQRTNHFAIGGATPDDAIFAVAITPDGRSGLCGFADGTLKLWDLKNGIEQCIFPNITSPISGILGLKIVSNRQLFISVSINGNLKIWNFENKRLVASFTADDRLLCCAVTHDGKKIIAGEDSGRLHFLELIGID